MVLFFISASISRILLTLSQSIFLLSLVFSVAYYLGWIHRLIWHVAEGLGEKVLNATKVTIGNIHFDLTRGKIWFSNVVIHSPKRDQFKWDSPLLARVGRLYVQGNFSQCMFSFLVLREEIPVDIYTLVAADIQVFIERRHNFFNFFLCDKQVLVPENLSELVGEMDDDDDPNAAISHEDEENSDYNISGSLHLAENMDPFVSSSSIAPEEKAQMLMGDMLRAISRAAKEGSITGALVEHRQKITDQLKALQVAKKSVAMKEGAEIVQHVSEAVIKKTQTVHKVVQPVRKESSNQKEKTENIRIGRIQIKDLRIFTQDHWEVEANKASTPQRRRKSTLSWRKPIVIHKVDVRSSELCPPLSSKDENDLPAMYQPVEKCLEVLWRRLLAEGAKTNSGNLFKTAMGEVLDYWTEKKNYEEK